MGISEEDLRMQYAGCIGLLCEMSTQVDDESRDSIIEAVAQWCESSGWTYKVLIHKVEVYPPQVQENAS